MDFTLKRCSVGDVDKVGEVVNGGKVGLKLNYLTEYALLTTDQSLRIEGAAVDCLLFLSYTLQDCYRLGTDDRENSE